MVRPYLSAEQEQKHHNHLSRLGGRMTTLHKESLATFASAIFLIFDRVATYKTEAGGRFGHFLDLKSYYMCAAAISTPSRSGNGLKPIFATEPREEVSDRLSQPPQQPFIVPESVALVALSETANTRPQSRKGSNENEQHQHPRNKHITFCRRMI